jgi:3-hydroxybutyryl-CoA dehydrogenase
VNLKEIKKVAVLGAGTMGNGIAHVFAKYGYDVVLRDIEQSFLNRAMDTIAKNLDREISKGKVKAEEKPSIVGRIRATLALEDLAGAQFVVEAVPENFDLKAKLWKEVERVSSPQAVFASNTSSISITKLAAQTSRPERFVGMHFMNPVPVMVLVEVIRGMATSDETFTLTMELAKKLEKTPVGANDFPGFISNRVLMPMINEAIYCVMEGVGTAEAVDQVMKLGMNHPMGPLTLADFIGLDVCLDIMEVLHRGLGDAKYRPCPLLRKMVDAGWLGRKSGRGFYTYT